MKIIVTGALGHIGSKLIRILPLHFRNSKIILLDNLSTQRYYSLFNLSKKADYVFYPIDIRFMNNDKIFKKASVVIHLAGQTDATTSIKNPDKLKKNNLSSTKNIVSICKKFNIPMIFSSSTSVYGSQKNIIDEFCDENELKPQSPYAEVKLLEEKLIQRNKNNLKFTIFRFGTIFGYSRGMRFHTAVNKFCWQAVMKEPITVWKTALKQKRPYLDINDCIRSIIFIIKNGIYNSEIYNAVTYNLTVEDIINEIKKNIRIKQIKFVDHKIMNQLSYEVLNTKLNKTKFKFRGDLSKGIKETINKIKNSNNIKL